MSLRLIGRNGEILLAMSFLYKVGGGAVSPSDYEVVKGGVDIPIEQIDLDENTFKVSINPITGNPYSQFILGEDIDISYGEFPFRANIADVGYDNLYQLSKNFDNRTCDITLFTSKVRRKIDLLRVFNLDEGLYYTDTGYMIIVSDNYENIAECPFSKIYNLRPDLEGDSIGGGGVFLWQLSNMRREAFSKVMNDIQIYKDSIGQNFKLLDIDPIMDLVALKTVSTYEKHHERDNLLHTYQYGKDIKAYRPEYMIDKLGGDILEAKINRIRF